MKRYTKKSAIDLTDLAIGVVVLGIVVSIGSTILVNLRDSRLTDLPTEQVVNETVTFSESGVSLSTRWVASVDDVINATSGEVLEAGNYTLSVDAGGGIGTITPASDSPFNGTSLDVTYTIYNTTRADWNLANEVSTGLGEYGNWFKIIIIVGVAAVILALIFMAFGNRKGSGDIGGSY